MPINFEQFSPEVLSAIEGSAAMVQQMGRNVVTPCDLLAGACAHNGETVCRELISNGVDPNELMPKIGMHISSLPPSSMSDDGVAFDDRTLHIFEISAQYATVHERVDTVELSHLVFVLISSSEDIIGMIGRFPGSAPLMNQNPGPAQQSPAAQPRQAAQCPAGARRNPADDDASTGETVREFCVNMLQLAADGKIRHAIGREQELQRVLLILARSSKNNPVLVGEPGTGKTAIAEELAIRLLYGQVPPALADLKLYSLDYTSVRARQNPAEVMQCILEEAVADPKLILFIDEIHMLISNCSCSDNDVANLLKPAMARGEIKLLGATTLDEYKRIEKDPAFERRFQKVIVDEPDVESATQILIGAKTSFESHHGVTIPDEVCKAAVTLSDRYIADRKLPDKAFDLIDEAAARLRIEDSRTKMVVNDVMKVVTEWTGIPVDDMDEDETRKLQNIESELHASVVGQDRAVKAVSDAIRRNRMGFSDASRPVGSFLFLGTTGTGKTELCKALAKFLFKDPDMMVRIDMSEYQQEYAVSRLFGAPPGYVGYEQGGQLTEAVRRKPFSVVLFDEIEKAHPKVFETLLQVLDDGRMTDGQGKLVDFKNTIIVMTSNMGQQEILQALCGRQATDDDINRCTDSVMRQLRQRVAPEFINRIDNIVMFMPLSKDDVARIAEINLKKEQKKLAEKNIQMSFTASVIPYVVARGYQPEYGGRPVKRAIIDHVINPLTNAMVDGRVNRNLPIIVSVVNDQIIFSNGSTSGI